MSARIACLLALLSAGQSLADPLFQPPPIVGPWNDPPLGDPATSPASWNFTNHLTGGYVESVGKDSITLYRPALRVVRLRHNPMTGEKLEETEVGNSPPVPAKAFLLGEELARGEYIKHPDVLGPDTYRITDVRAGDRVFIHYDRRGGVDVCRTISIVRRPGGRIPPAPGERLDAFRKHHEQCNADQDWEEKRLPYPRKYMPTYLGPDGKFYDGPYPSEYTLIIPVPSVEAPPPREVRKP